ncbi:EthD family reductase [Methylogaea oryzae]|uniref:Ethyl tert-butyl ether degradation protein EthD n=1 Tax=Methylogaea oryzae TaxID=1295382 RepID=A0A8D4VPF1_9GAMM|nr:EthD family reductase [Methylogaea oryzae]BBL70944.1 ethyl tert-butyl ether degradation protein EthD [Methylogaea oryzae]
MVKISILYPNTPGARFDFAYYADTHMPRSIELLSAHPGFKGVSVERGVGGATPGSAPAYLAMCHFHFSTADDFLQAFMPHAPELQGDMPNYTDIEPIVQINEVLISR